MAGSTIPEASMTTAERPDRCETCRFWFRDPPRPLVTEELVARNPQVVAGNIDAHELVEIENAGECRRMPPQYLIWDTDIADSRWPRTQPDDWCGEWKRMELDVVTS